MLTLSEVQQLRAMIHAKFNDIAVETYTRTEINEKIDEAFNELIIPKSTTLNEG